MGKSKQMESRVYRHRKGKIDPVIVHFDSSENDMEKTIKGSLKDKEKISKLMRKQTKLKLAITKCMEKVASINDKMNKLSKKEKKVNDKITAQLNSAPLAMGDSTSPSDV